MYNPQELLFQSVIGEGTVDPSQKADDILTHNENWQDKYSQVYLNDTVGQSYSSYGSYWAILSGILSDPDSPKDDFLIPYTEEDIAVLYKEESGTFYFWMPYHGARLKVYDDNGTVVFESDFVKDFGDGVQLETMESLKDELETTEQETREKVDQIKEIVYRDEKVYGFHIDSSESDPYECVTYLADAVNMTPAKMDFTNDVFNWGSWGNAFFLPKPCMLRYDGTVDYYLNPNDYSKKEDGTSSDVADFSYNGNAMMEWGQNGKRIWYKIIPDTDPSSASVYIASYQVDSDYRCWSFINNQGKLAEHFYTPIYNGSIDTAGRLRSISGKTYSDLCQSKTVAQEVAAAELNNPSTDKLWYTEVFSDITIINFLLILIGKSLNTQATFGNGVQGQANEASSMISTGTMNSKGLFWGDDDNTHGVKTFGMENWWGNQNRRYAGHIKLDSTHKYKMTRGTQDGSTATDYNETSNGYLTAFGMPSSSSGEIRLMSFGHYGMYARSRVDGTVQTYYCDRGYFGDTQRGYALFGGSCGVVEGRNGAFGIVFSRDSDYAAYQHGASISCKPIVTY